MAVQPAHAPTPDSAGSVIIGRNEGERLRRCLDSQPEGAVVYVDSGSTDGSVASARASGVTVVELPVPPKFTAARARNAGLRALLAAGPGHQFVQFVDGDCELRAGWVDTAVQALQADPGLAVVFGRRRERFPERSVYNALCDDEWNTPIGEASACGGDAVMRIAALKAVGGYRDDMIAGEEPDLCMRLRAVGWRIARLDAEMTWHDADVTRFAQWWARSRRAGHAFAELAYLHPEQTWPNWSRSCWSILAWTVALPLVTVATGLLAVVHHPSWWAVAAVLALAWPLKMVQLGVRQLRRGLPGKVAAASGALLMMGKFPQLAGFVEFHVNRLRGRGSQLIEYKGH